ncbi:MAG: cobalamin-binding protein [Planctomycetota bacterium]
MRVVSLLPSATELLCAIGAEDMLVGRSHECDYPASIADRPVLTGQRTVATTSADIDRQVREALQQDDSDRSLYTLDVDQLRALEPDVILTQDLCDVCSIDLKTVRGVVATMSPEPSVVSLNPQTLEDIYDDILTIGQAIGRTEAADAAMVSLRGEYWTAVDYTNPYMASVPVAFLEWMDPLFAGGHWTPQLINAAGGAHVLNEPGAKSRQISADDLVSAKPERLIVCPCGYDLPAIEREMPALCAQPWWSELPAVQANQVVLVDGNQMFNRPGPRLVTAFRWLVSWLHDRDEVRPAGFPVKRWDCATATAGP